MSAQVEKPDSTRGHWYNPKTGETLHPDTEHPAPVGPHWDWRADDGNWYRWFPDGSVKPKKRVSEQGVSIRTSPLRSEGLDYIGSHVAGGRGLCATLNRQRMSRGKLYAVAAEGLSAAQIGSFLSGTGLSMHHAIAWLGEHLSRRLGEFPSATILLQDVYAEPDEQNVRAPASCFAHRGCLYYASESREIDYAEADRLIHEPISFPLVGFVSDYALPREVLSSHQASDAVMDALAHNLVGLFVGAYDQEGFVLWERDE